ncbi:beta-ketoacyl synthase N-terminal-like domain-containing protein, partial [Streptomyces sp. CJ_13]|uniref:type I polyketide synthase n=1 Tax=Streptomyces sp. CJ_13 TaxID=2724943 RepID=UPI0027E2E401
MIDPPAREFSSTDTHSPEALASWMVEQIARRIEVPANAMDMDDRFADLGLSSREGVTLIGELQSLLEKDLSPALLWEYPSIRELSDFLAGKSASTDSGSPEPKRPQARVEESSAEPVAVIGMGCRFPGARGPEEFWRLLVSGTDAVTATRSSTPPGVRSRGPQGHLEDIDLFDSEFFGITRREADRMDPQQRMLLEVAWEALEHAGIAPDALRGTPAGVFVGISNSDYGRLDTSGPRAADPFVATGQALSIAANRISYTLDLRGPSVAVDTACSSSLVAVDQACRSLRDGESSIALAAGVNLILDTLATDVFTGSGMLAADGRCKTFDAAADGYVRAEGCGVVVLKPLSAARRDGDRVLALVRGTAVNQDGHSNGLTAPQGLAQRDVIAAALRNGGTAPREIGYAEAHGTGTSLGDPIEVRALSTALGEGRDTGEPCRIGSVKTNIGHAESAAGIAGLIKTVLVLVHGVIPPHLHLRTLNPRIELPSWMSVPVAALPWPEGETPRVAGVSSFGFGGTNAHVILAEAPGEDEPAPPAVSAPRPVHVLTLSARTPTALRRLARSYADHLGRAVESGTERIADVCHTANTGRSVLDIRAALVATDLSRLREQAEALADGRGTSGLLTAEKGRSPGRLAFLFTGQGSQYAGMSRELYTAEPVFRAALLECADLLKPFLDRPLLEVLFANEAGSPIHRTEYAQPALFAVEYALTRLWDSWGVRPDAVLGHSIGELVAACVAGVLDLAEGLRLAAERGRLMQRLPSGGGMLAVAADEDVVRAALSGRGLDIAAVNGPAGTVVSGPLAELSSLREELTARNVMTRRLRTGHAFHSRLMAGVSGPLAELAATLTHRAPSLTLISDLDGSLFEDGRHPDAGYWARHAREPVRFGDGLRTLRELGCDSFLEIGPGRTLTGLVRTALPSATAVSSLREGAADHAHILTSLAALHVAGVPIDPDSFEKGQRVHKTVLPTYPFEGRRHWNPAVAPPGLPDP